MKRIDRTLVGGSTDDTLARRMLQARERAGLDRKDAAAKIGLSPGHLARVERGGVQMVADPATLVRAASAYGVSQVWLYAGAHAGQKLIPDWYGAPRLELGA